MNKRKKHQATELICPFCKNIQTIYRSSGHLKEAGHLKRLYCYKCKKVTNHVELKDRCYFEVKDFKNLKPINKKHDKVLCIQKEVNYEDMDNL